MYLFMNEILDSTFSIHYVAKCSRMPNSKQEQLRLLFVINKNTSITAPDFSFTEIRLLSDSEALHNRNFPALVLTINDKQINSQWEQLEFKKDCLFIQDAVASRALTKEQSRTISFIFQKTFSCYDDDSSKSQLILYSWLYELLCTVQNIYQVPNDNNRYITEGRDTISNVISYISKNYMENISIDTLSTLFYISKYHLMREFKKATGCTIHTFLLKQRITQAQNMIAKGIHAGTASALVGFSDYSLFYRSFLKFTGSSPREYYSDNDMLIAE